MKKVITICMTLALILALIPAAAADWDLSDFSFDDLIALRAQVQLEMMSRPDYEEVEVPLGVYKVGEDIPAGTWRVLCRSGYVTAVEVGVNLNEAGTELNYPYKAHETISNENANIFSGGTTEWSVTVSDGDYICVEISPAIFTTYTGKPSLGFKALS